jgi:hypothetical protein
MPRISEHVKKDLLMEALRRRIRHLYIYGESHPMERELIAAKLDGFLEAALLLRICTKDEAQRLIDEEHLAIFEMSRGERATLRRQQNLTNVPDWTPYETPSAERMSSKKRRARSYGVKARTSTNHHADPKAVRQINGQASR